MRVLIAAGGTAGHINPALAIAGALKKADPTAEIHFAGRKEGMEYRLVTQAGYPFHHIEITGFQRKLSLHNINRNIVTLWNLALSGPKAKAIMKEVQPDLVIGCGGYVSGPVVRCAAKMGIHTALHEQNAFPGVTNKLLAPDVDIVFAAVPAAVEKLGAPQKTIVVGNPVRPEVFTQAKNRDAIRAQLGAGDRTVILSFGGSLGARRVNEVVGDLCAWEQHEHKPVLHLHAYGHAVDAPGFTLPAFDSPESRTYKLRTSGGFQPPLAFATLDEAADDIAAGRAVLISGEKPVLSGPYVLQADAEVVVERLDAAGAPKDAPVVVSGDEAQALDIAKALYAAGRPLVFRLSAGLSERLAA